MAKEARVMDSHGSEDCDSRSTVRTALATVSRASAGGQPVGATRHKLHAWAIEALMQISCCIQGVSDVHCHASLQVCELADTGCLGEHKGCHSRPLVQGAMTPIMPVAQWLRQRGHSAGKGDPAAGLRTPRFGSDRLAAALLCGAWTQVPAAGAPRGCREPIGSSSCKASAANTPSGQ